MNEIRFSFFNRIANSMMNFSFYKHVILERTGKAVAYFLLLTLFLGLIITIRPIIALNVNITLFINAFEQKVPDFNIENGELNVHGEMPITLESEGSILIIDTSGKTSEAVLESYPSGVFVSKHKLIQKNLFDRREIDFRQLEGLSMDKETVSGWLPYMRLTNILLGMFVLAGFMIFRFITALFVALIGLVIGSSAGLRLRFADAFKLSAHALTLPLLIVAVLKAAGVEVPFFFVIYILIAAIYLWKAVSAVKDDSLPKES